MANIGDIKVSSILNMSQTLVSTSATVGFDRTFSPDENKGGVASWVDRSSGIELGFPRFSLQVRPSSRSFPSRKVSAWLTVPTLEVTSPSTATGIQPQPTLAYIHTARLDFSCPQRGSAAERDALISMLMSLLATTINANDGSPSDATSSPLLASIRTGERPY